MPISFLHKYCPEQFEIIKFRKGNDEKDLTFTILPSKLSQKPEARSQKPEARSQKPEARSQKPEAKPNQKPNQKPSQTKPSQKPETREPRKPEAKPETKPEAKPNQTKPEAKPSQKPNPRRRSPRISESSSEKRHKPENRHRHSLKIPNAAFGKYKVRGLFQKNATKSLLLTVMWSLSENNSKIFNIHNKQELYKL
ncbi:adenine-specific methyltransferase EcoRI family protein [Treponema parvum]|uniref:adenine-specific methyltransferase EcoRI family protein n=1 Tax=Treponema parvum TaxID=138851 RepID=UPI003207F43B